MTTIGRPVWFRFVRQTAAIGRIFLLATPFIEGLLTDVAPAQTSPAALRKRASKVTASGGPVHTFHSLLRDLATCTLNEMTTTLNGWAEPITGYSLAGSTASRLKAWAWIGVGVATSAKL